VGRCECADEPSIAIRGGTFLESLSDCQLLKMTAVWSQILFC
jgi:hypothetical protein